tara:strand:- start:108 stop:704 length:597 start_codon:yes stop_codon:yes gene_type:complete
MNKRIIIQLILFFIVILLIALFFFKYLVKQNIDHSDIKKIITSTDSYKNSSNIIENIRYKSSDNLGAEYIITAKYGEILETSSNLMQMKDVEAEVISVDQEKIFITATNATYNIIDYDTNFKGNIIIKFGEHNLTCDNADLFFKDNKIKVYNNVNYNNLSTDILADGLEIDLLTKNSMIYMNNQNKKIKLIYKNNGRN